MAGNPSHKRRALRLGAASIGLGAAFVLGNHAARAAAWPAAPAGTTTSQAPAAPKPKAPAPKPDPAPAEPKKTRWAPAARPEPKPATKPPSPGPAPTEPPPDPPAPEPAAEIGKVDVQGTPDAAKAATATPVAAPATPVAAAATAATPIAAAARPITPDACGGDCGQDMRSWITGRAYDSGTDTWTITTVADVFSEVGCYVDPVCVIRIDTSGQPVQGPPPILACALGWVATGDGGCRRTEGTAVGSGFKATVTTTAAPPPYFELPFVLTWEHLDLGLPVASSSNPVFLDAPMTVVGDCPASSPAGSTITCKLQAQIPPGTTAPATMYFFGGGDPDRPDLVPVSLTTSDPNWVCFGSFCQTSSPVVGAWTTFESVSLALPTASGGHAMVWGMTPVIPPPSGNPFGYALGIFITTPTDANVPNFIQLPPEVHPGQPATVAVTYTNNGGGPAENPFLIVGVLADLASKSFTTDVPPGWECGWGTPNGGGDGPFVFCSSDSQTLPQGASVTIKLTFTLPENYDVSVPLPVIAYSQWGPDGNTNPHHISTAVAAVTAAPNPGPNPGPTPTPTPTPSPAPGDPGEPTVKLVSDRTPLAASVAGLPTTGADPSGLLGIGSALLAAGATLTSRSRKRR